MTVMFNTVLYIIEGPNIDIEKDKIDPDIEVFRVYLYSICVYF